MPSFGTKSLYQLSTCDERLQRVFNEVIRTYDCTVIQGYRSPQEQAEKFAQGRSRVRLGKHNVSPSMAVDVAPWIEGRGIPWPKEETTIKDWMQFAHFVGYVMATAERMGIRLRSGLDWDRDFNLNDQTFDDAPHFELVD